MAIFSKISAAISMFNKADLKYRNNQFEEAIELFTKTIEIDSDFSRVYNDRGLCYHILGNITKAEQDYCKAILVDDLDLDVHWNLGCLYAENNQLKNAVQKFNELIIASNKTLEIDSNSFYAFYSRGHAKYKLLRLYNSRGEINKDLNGKADLESSCTLNPEFAEPYYVISLIHIFLDENQGLALENIDCAISKNPLKSNYYYLRAQQTIKMSSTGHENAKLENALKDLSKAKELGYNSQKIEILLNKIKNKSFDYSDNEKPDYRDFSNLCPVCGDPNPCFCAYYLRHY